MSAQPKGLYHTRPLMPADIDAVVHIEQQSYDFPWNKRVFEDCLRVGYHCFVAVGPDRRVAGYALLSIAVDEAHVLNLCVDPACRRRGVAQLLLERMLAEARLAGMNAMLLEVRPSNRGARALYAAYGFKRISVRPNYYPATDGREDALLLSRRVTRPF